MKYRVWLLGLFADATIKEFIADNLKDLEEKVTEYIKKNPRWKTWSLVGGGTYGI